MSPASRAGPDGLYCCCAVMVKIPARPSVDVSPARLEGDVRVKVECLWRRSRQVTAQPEQVSGRVLPQTCHLQLNGQ